MEREYKYKIGDNVIFKDSYWGKMSGKIYSYGHQGKTNIYGVILDSKFSGSSTVCKEKEIIRVVEGG